MAGLQNIPLEGPRARSQAELLRVTQFIPQERIVVVFPVHQLRNKLWES